MKPTVLVTRRIPRSASERIQKLCEVRLWDSDDAIPREKLLDMIAGVDGLYCLITDQIDEPCWQQLATA